MRCLFKLHFFADFFCAKCDFTIFLRILEQCVCLLFILIYKIQFSCLFTINNYYIGAPVPNGADAVIQVEDTELTKKSQDGTGILISRVLFLNFHMNILISRVFFYRGTRN